MIELTRTTPLNIATPNKAMKPTEADKFRFMPRTQSAAMPPISANGILPMTSNAWEVEEDEDDPDHHGQDELKPMGSSLLVLELASILNVIAGTARVGRRG